MKIKTYTGPDMRNALRQVREEQGPDAVILSSRQVFNGVEVSVAVEGNATDDAQILPAAGLESRVTAAQPAPRGPEFAELISHAAVAVQPPTPSETELRMGEELRTMRFLLERQLSQLAWNDLTRRAPETAELLKDLTAMGVAAGLATELLAELPDGIGLVDAQRRVLATLTRRIATTGDELLDRGGRVAFVGPTGVGKTTAIAKLAARWVMRYGTRDIALVSLDDQRFGAQEQLRVLGRLLGVECYSLEGSEGLVDLLGRLSHRLVLIDTAGINAGHKDLPVRAAEFKQAVHTCKLAVWLTLSAGAQAGVIGEAMQKFSAFEPSALVLTRLDEAMSLGGTLSALATNQLPVAYVANGSRIPEDLAPARAHALVARAVYLARIADTTVGEELLASRFGGVANAIR